MAEILYRCPRTRMNAQGWLAEDAPPTRDQHVYVSIQCPACGQLHMVNPASKKVLGHDKAT